MLSRTRLVAVLVAGAVAAVLPHPALGHCDALDGPVVSAARAAIEKKDLAPVLKWIGPDSEGEIRAAFARTLAVRGLSPEAKELADRSFFESVVRLHRAKEGGSLHGFEARGDRPPVRPCAPWTMRSRRGRPTRSRDSSRSARPAAVRRRFGQLLEARRRAEDNLEAGRRFTASYAEFTHWIEALYGAAEGSTPPADAPEHVHH